MASEKLTIEERVERIEEALGGLQSCYRISENIGYNQSMGSGYESKDVAKLREKLETLEDFLKIKYVPEKNTTDKIPAHYGKIKER